MHACRERGLACAHYVMLTERGRSYPRPGTRACIAKAISICTYIYIYTYRNIYVRACTHAYRCCTHARPPQPAWFENPAANSNSTLPAAAAAAMPSPVVYYGPLVYIYIYMPRIHIYI